MRPGRMMDGTQFRALLKAARDRRGLSAKRDLFLLWFLGRTGLRVSELLPLTVGALVLDGTRPFVRVVTLKSGAERIDDVLLEGSTVRGVRAWCSKYLPLATVSGKVASSTPLVPRVYGEHHGERMQRRNALRIFRFYAARAGLPRELTLHSLRHYRGSVLYGVTHDLEFTREQLRHRSIATTQHYLRSTPEQVAGYMDALEEELARR